MYKIPSFRRHLLLSLVLLLSAMSVSAQEFPQNEAQFDSIYARRILLEEIDGVYIPRNLEDAFVELRRLSSPADIEKFKSATEEIVRKRLFFGLGRWMIVNWGFYEGSRISHHLKGLGILHPDDMARVILVCFHRHLHQQDLRIADEVAFYQAFREKELMEREGKKEVISEEKQVKKD